MEKVVMRMGIECTDAPTTEEMPMYHVYILVEDILKLVNKLIPAAGISKSSINKKYVFAYGLPLAEVRCWSSHAVYTYICFDQYYSYGRFY